MSAVETCFLEPLDVLFLRGNKLFGDPGSFGESLVPPWPSVAAGALRSRMLADDQVDLAAFARGEIPHPTLGTPQHPGPFAVTAFHLARRHADGRVEALIQPPADLVIGDGDDGKPRAAVLAPTRQAAGLASSAPFALLPILAETERSKPESGYWLSESGWSKYLSGEAPDECDLVKSSALWRIDPRVGVGLDTVTRRAADGQLFSVQAVAMVKRGHRIVTGKPTDKPIIADYDVGFLAVIAGTLPRRGGTLRLGGDGRAAAIRPVATALPKPDYDAIARAGRCRLTLTTPALFGSPRSQAGDASEGRGNPGWLPTGIMQTGEGEFRFDLHGVSGRLVCAAVPRAEVISGWDLAKWQPKPARRVAPTGSVYWLDQLEATPEALCKLVERGLWSEPCDDAARRAEGFNRITFAAY